jgi:biopolymer transport protein ExbB
MREFFIKGGPVMWPLLGCSLVALAVIIERMLFWVRAWRRRVCGTASVAQVLDLSRSRDFDKAAELAERTADSVARVLAAGLRQRGPGMSDHLAVAAEEELASMRRGMAVLDTIVTIAPLLGILGTVTGIIGAFDMLGGSEIQEPKAVVGGLAEALITTAAGLVIAIGTVVPFNLFRARIGEEAKRIESAATLLEAACRQDQESAGAS